LKVIVNLKAAKEHGISIPTAQPPADEVIE
jgi:hypothetical protein